MENNNAIAAQGPDGDSKIENVKPTADDEESPKRRGYNRFNRRRQIPKEIHPEDGNILKSFSQRINTEYSLFFSFHLFWGGNIGLIVYFNKAELVSLFKIH